jgi:hypothetical protein
MKTRRGIRTPWILVRLAAAALACASCGIIAGLEKQALPEADAVTEPEADAIVPDAPGEDGDTPVPDAADAVDGTEDGSTPGTCTIEGEVYANGEKNPDDECQACVSDRSVDEWSAVQDLTPCTGGICCGMQCRPGGTCCRSSDCPGRCTGTPAACTSVTSQAECTVQDGCTWTSFSGTCTGTSFCEDIEGVTVSNMETCMDCGCREVNCGAVDCTCGGVPDPCTDHATEQDCLTCACIFVSTAGECSGEHAPCGASTIEAGCRAQSGCAWTEGSCSGYVCEF